MDISKILELPHELLVLWHEHRLEVLVSVLVVLAVVRISIVWRSTRPKQSITPLASPKAAAKDKKEAFNSIPDIVVSGTDSIDDGKVELRDADHLVDIVAAPKRAPSPPKTASSGPKRVAGVKRTKSKTPEAKSGDEEAQVQPLIFFYSLAGGTEGYANKLAQRFGIDNPRCLAPQVHNLVEIDADDYFVTPPKKHESGRRTNYFYLLLIPSYNIDTELQNFLMGLEETHHDFRIDTAPLQTLLGYSVFGFGDKEGWPSEGEGFCYQAREVDKWMARLTGRKRAYPLGFGDVKSDVDTRLDAWRSGVLDVLQDVAQGKGLGEGVPGSGDAVESDEEDLPSASESDEEGAREKKPKKTLKKRKDTSGDLEDLGLNKSDKASIPIDFTTYKKKPSAQQAAPSTGPKEMVPKESPTYTSLTKQGYQIVGSHSGVKICRWTKSALRGRGSCYKYSFYGIRSHLCMETTPSLSCSNKCVFCWRHGTNPVGTTWRWKVDPPELVFEGVKAGHYKKIKMMRGVPGVRAARFEEAMRIRHCALSLVGEPIFYPHINEFLGMLHAEHISSFLVCNAQHPDQLRALGPVTQLYVSIDASNKTALRKIDRPLHRDFWERFCECMDILREKRHIQRTVFRLTLVKGFNLDDEAKGYADLVERALPGFVEVKGVTYCGTSTSSSAGLSMSNVPFYSEVCEFVLALVKELNSRGFEYGIAAEHAHSCCILIADKKRFYKEDGWHTLIDYERFFERLESGETFGPEDYIGGKNPEWCLWGNGGFNPEDERVDRKGRPVDPDTVRVGGGRVMEIE